MTYRVVIPGFLPTSLNVLKSKHWASAQKHKDRDAREVDLACVLADLPRVAVSESERKTRKILGIDPVQPRDPEPIRRRVSLEITWPKGQRSLDPDNIMKSLCDALVRGGYLVDDCLRWCEFVLPPIYHRGETAETVIVIEDLDPMPKMPRRRKVSAKP